MPHEACRPRHRPADPPRAVLHVCLALVASSTLVVITPTDRPPTVPGAISVRRLTDGIPIANPALDRIWQIDMAALRLRRSRCTTRAEPDAPALPTDFPDDPLFQDGRQWGLDNRGARGAYGGVAGADIRARAAWTMSVGAGSVRLALADTGVDPQHPELEWPLPGGARLTGWNATAEFAGTWADSLGHGTNVAGIMSARTNDGAHFDSLGVAGVCGGDGAANPGCRLLAIKITAGRVGSRRRSTSRAILFAVSQGARAINVSFVSRFPSSAEREALRAMPWRVVVSSWPRPATTPRRIRGQRSTRRHTRRTASRLQVGASDMWDRRASFSSYGPGLDLVAPGQTIWTTSPTYENVNHVPLSRLRRELRYVDGGAVRHRHAGCSRPAARSRRRRHARADGPHRARSGAPGGEQTGAGVLDAAAALRAAGPGIGVWHDEVAADAWLRRAGTRSWSASIGAMEGPRTWPRARRIEARATIVPARLVRRLGRRVAARRGHDDGARRLPPAILRTASRSPARGCPLHTLRLKRTVCPPMCRARGRRRTVAIRSDALRLHGDRTARDIAPRRARRGTRGSAASRPTRFAPHCASSGRPAARSPSTMRSASACASGRRMLASAPSSGTGEMPRERSCGRASTGSARGARTAWPSPA